MAAIAHSQRKSKVADFINRKLHTSSRTQREIAGIAGFQRENILSMIKTGVTKLPIARVPALAEALEVEPLALFQLCIEEYMPDLLPVLEQIYGKNMPLSANETKIIKKLRALSQNEDPKLSANNEDWLRNFVRDA